MDDSRVTYTPVTSSNLEAVGYDAAAQRLWVKFKGGRKYRYEGVPADLHARLMAAASKGSFFAAKIRDTFEFHRE